MGIHPGEGDRFVIDTLTKREVKVLKGEMLHHLDKGDVEAASKWLVNNKKLLVAVEKAIGMETELHGENKAFRMPSLARWLIAELPHHPKYAEIKASPTSPLQMGSNRAQPTASGLSGATPAVSKNVTDIRKAMQLLNGISIQDPNEVTSRPEAVRVAAQVAQVMQPAVPLIQAPVAQVIQAPVAQVIREEPAAAPAAASTISADALMAAMAALQAAGIKIEPAAPVAVGAQAPVAQVPVIQVPVAQVPVAQVPVAQVPVAQVNHEAAKEEWRKAFVTENQFTDLYGKAITLAELRAMPKAVREATVVHNLRNGYINKKVTNAVLNGKLSYLHESEYVKSGADKAKHYTPIIMRELALNDDN